MPLQTECVARDNFVLLLPVDAVLESESRNRFQIICCVEQRGIRGYRFSGIFDHCSLA